MINFLAKLHKLDRRWLYLIMIVLVISWFVFSMNIPGGAASNTTLGVYNAIDACPDDEIILVDSSWDAGSKSENEAQLESVIKHIIKAKKKFIVTSVGVSPYSPEFATNAIMPIAKEAGYVYGEDWAQAGFIQAGAGGVGVVIDALCRDFRTIYPTDLHGTPLEEVPLMKDIKTINDFNMVYCVTYAPPEQWISFVKGQFDVPVAFGCMTIMAPTYYPYFMSGQLKGMLIGNTGASEYEKLMGYKGIATRLITPASFANIVIILAAVMGNIGLWASRKKKREEIENG